MTVVAVLADPPREGVLPRVVGGTPLSAADAAALYEATLSDALRAVATSGGDLLVCYRPADLLPDGGTGDPEARVRAVAEEALSDLGTDPHFEAARFERQVGSSQAARVGNVVTHLLREEDAESAAVVWPTAPLAGRTEVDGAAMKLRTAETVLGPTTDGGLYYAGFTEPVDFADALVPPAVETLTERAAAAELGTNLLEITPSVATPAGLALTVSLLRARSRGGLAVPSFTAAAVEALGLRTVTGEDGLAVTTDEDGDGE